jgi:hypothetical protein
MSLREEFEAHGFHITTRMQDPPTRTQEQNSHLITVGWFFGKAARIGVRVERL